MDYLNQLKQIELEIDRRKTSILSINITSILVMVIAVLLHLVVGIEHETGEGKQRTLIIGSIVAVSIATFLITARMLEDISKIDVYQEQSRRQREQQWEQEQEQSILHTGADEHEGSPEELETRSAGRGYADEGEPHIPEGEEQSHGQR